MEILKHATLLNEYMCALDCGYDGIEPDESDGACSDAG